MELEELKQQIQDDLKLDLYNLDEDALATPKLYGKYLSILSDEALRLKRITNTYRKLKLERWKYYSGKQSNTYYTKHPLDEKILKTDIPNYMEADEMMIRAEELLEEQKIKVKLIEECMKQLANRSFQIRDAIEWRKFQDGVR